MTSLVSDLSLKDTAAIGTVVEAFFYGTLSTRYNEKSIYSSILGVYCLIFGQYLHVYLRKKKNERTILVYPLTILFLLSTLNFILNLPQTFWLVVSNMCNTSAQILS